MSIWDKFAKVFAALDEVCVEADRHEDHGHGEQGGAAWGIREGEGMSVDMELDRLINEAWEKCGSDRLCDGCILRLAKAIRIATLNKAADMAAARCRNHPRTTTCPGCEAAVEIRGRAVAEKEEW